jgi:filamentous hemagglutinin
MGEGGIWGTAVAVGVFAPQAYAMLLRNPRVIIAATVALDETGVLAATGFFAGTRYTQKVLAQMAQEDMHGFPESVRAFECSGVVSKLTGGDGIVRDMLKIPGSYKGKDGFFEFIKEADGTINHRFFREN